VLNDLRQCCTMIEVLFLDFHCVGSFLVG